MDLYVYAPSETGAWFCKVETIIMGGTWAHHYQLAFRVREFGIYGLLLLRRTSFLRGGTEKQLLSLRICLLKISI